MEIVWKQNPLTTVVKLDDKDRELLRAKITIAQLEQFIWNLTILIDPQFKRYDVKKAHDLIKDFNLAKIEKTVDDHMEYYISDLQDTHAGDCTCFPMTCAKCLAESYLGINTTEGLGSHEALAIYNKFEKHGNDINAVIKALEEYKVIPYSENPAWNQSKLSEEYYLSCIPQWEEEARRASVWLKKYKEDHLKDLE